MSSQPRSDGSIHFTRGPGFGLTHTWSCCCGQASSDHLLSHFFSSAPVFDQLDVVSYEEVVRLPAFKRKTLVLIGRSCPRHPLQRQCCVWRVPGGSRGGQGLGQRCPSKPKLWGAFLLPAVVTKQADLLHASLCVVWHLHCDAEVELIKEFPASKYLYG